RPPSENESGVTLTTPITRHRPWSGSPGGWGLGGTAAGAPAAPAVTPRASSVIAVNLSARDGWGRCAAGRRGSLLAPAGLLRGGLRGPAGPPPTSCLRGRAGAVGGGAEAAPDAAQAEPARE